jgi:putative transposase
MRRSYKFRLRPTARQHIALAACIDAHREVYNAALQERRDAWQATRTRISYGDQSAQLTDIRAERPDIAIWSFSSQQATLRRLNRAFDGFFRRLKAGAKPGFPRFKSQSRFQSAEWPKDGDGARWHPDTNRVYLKGIGQVKVTVHRAVRGEVKTIQVRREGRRWMLVLSCDKVANDPLPTTGKIVGVDVGVASFVTTSDGRHICNPLWTRVASDKLSRAQRALVRKQSGSNNRRKARQTLAARHRKIANQRRDFHHKRAHELVTDYDLIAVEDLNIANMLRRAKPVPDLHEPGRFLPNGAAAKSGLNRSIGDAAWGQFISILRAKAEDAGRAYYEIDPRHTSDRCEQCGYADKKNRVTQALFACHACGYTAHADEHAARNILRAGLARHAAEAA